VTPSNRKNCLKQPEISLSRLANTLVPDKKNVGEQFALQRFLHKGKLYQETFKEYRTMVASTLPEEEAQSSTISSSFVVPEYTPPPVIVPSLVTQEEQYKIGSKFLKTQENVAKHKQQLKQQQQQQLQQQRPYNPNDPVTVTDQVFDYLGEILDHNVLSDGKEQEEQEQQQQQQVIEDVDLDAL